MTGAFADIEMSVDWSKYSTPDAARRRGINALENAVAGFAIAEVRRIPGQTVEHAPDIETMNRAHSHVKGIKNAEAKMELRNAAKILIPIPLS